MDSLHILAPSNEELLSLAYDEEVLPEEKREHLERCEICQQRLVTYRRTNSRLLSRLYRSVCPGAVELNYYCLGAVPEEERVSIASHLLDCPACTDDVAEIRRMQAAFEPFPPAVFSLRTAARRLFATLVVQQAQPVTRDMAPSTGPLARGQRRNDAAGHHHRRRPGHDRRDFRRSGGSSLLRASGQ